MSSTYITDTYPDTFTYNEPLLWRISNGYPHIPKNKMLVSLDTETGLTTVQFLDTPEALKKAKRAFGEKRPITVDHEQIHELISMVLASRVEKDGKMPTVSNDDVYHAMIPHSQPPYQLKRFPKGTVVTSNGNPTSVSKETWGWLKSRIEQLSITTAWNSGRTDLDNVKKGFMLNYSFYEGSEATNPELRFHCMAESLTPEIIAEVERDLETRAAESPS